MYLVQHGEAEPREIDPKRPLSSKGREDVRKLANFIKPLKLTVYAIWHSNKKRAIQTAEILSEVINSEKRRIECEGLAPNDDVKILAKELESAKKDIMIVGHLPFLSKLTSQLLVGDEQAGYIEFTQGDILCLVHSEETAWQICWIITPNLLK